MNSCLLATSRSNVPRPKLLRNLRTYDLSETIEATSHGVTSKSMKNLSDPDFWTWDMTMVALGKCYTLNYSSNLTMDQERDSLLFQLSTNKSAEFFLHESPLSYVSVPKLRSKDGDALNMEKDTLISFKLKWTYTVL